MEPKRSKLKKTNKLSNRTLNFQFVIQITNKMNSTDFHFTIEKIVTNTLVYSREVRIQATIGLFAHSSNQI